MKKVQHFQVSRAVMIALLLTGLTGCASQQPRPAEAVPTSDGVDSASALRIANESPTPASPSARTSKATKAASPSESGASSKAEDPTGPARVITKNDKPPKTWPKNSRNSDAEEKTVTNGFISKSEKMTSPNFGKKLLNPETTVPPPPDYTAVAKGAALGELEAQYMEYAASNWKQTGEISIVGEPKTEDVVIDDVLTHRVYLCIDSSSVQVTESDGFVVTPTAKPGTRTALNIYDLQEQDGQLLVVDHIFPEDPNC